VGNESKIPTYQKVDGDYKKLKQADLRSWDLIHKKAAAAKTIGAKLQFEQYILYLVDNFPCEKCRPHIKKYMEKHPLEKCYDIKDDSGRDIGFAEWSWKFHNSVNKRNDGDVFPWKIFAKKYLRSSSKK